MPNIDGFTITANASILNELYLCMPCCSDNYIKLNRNNLSFDIYYFYDMEVVGYIGSASKKYPNEIISFTFAAETHNYCKNEHYEVRNGRFTFKGITWKYDVICDDSDNMPELIPLSKLLFPQ